MCLDCCWLLRSLSLCQHKHGNDLFKLQARFPLQAQGALMMPRFSFLSQLILEVDSAKMPLRLGSCLASFTWCGRHAQDRAVSLRDRSSESCDDDDRVCCVIALAMLCYALGKRVAGTGSARWRSCGPFRRCSIFPMGATVNIKRQMAVSRMDVGFQIPSAQSSYAAVGSSKVKGCLFDNSNDHCNPGSLFFMKVTMTW